MLTQHTSIPFTFTIISNYCVWLFFRVQYTSHGLQMVLIALVNVYNQGLNPPVCLAKTSERKVWSSLVMGLSGIRNVVVVHVALKRS